MTRTRGIAVIGAVASSLFFLALVPVSAQQSPPAICGVLQDLIEGSTGTGVTSLQSFLASQGDFTVTPTGFFGPITEAALVQFQNATGITAQAGGNGIFGPFTRDYIAANFCNSFGSSPPNAPSRVLNSSGELTASPTSGEAPLTVTFSGIGSNISFGDGTNQSAGGALGVVSHTYTSPGTYIAVSNGLSATITVVASTQDGGTSSPAGSISSFTASGNAPLTVTFYVSCTNAATYDISFGDGSDLGSSAAQAECNGQLQAITHTYTTAGSYEAQLDLLVQQGNGTFVTQTAGSVTVTVTGSSAATSTLTANPSSGAAPLGVAFQGDPSWVGDTITFGDGSSETMNQVIDDCPPEGTCTEGGPHSAATHTYQSAGTYTAEVVSPCSGGTNCAILGTATVTVTGGTTSNVSFTASPSSGAAPLSVTFTANGLAWDQTYTINFGDGSSQQTQTPFGGPAGSGSTVGTNVIHTYQSAGTYIATLTAPGIYNCPNNDTDCGVVASTTVTVTSAVTGACVVPSQDLSLGDSDADSNGQVSVLQTFLVDQGSSIYPAQLVTGFFGNDTLAGVRNFQAKYGIDQTGFVGPLTIAAMQTICNGGTPSAASSSFSASSQSGSAPLAVTFTAIGYDVPQSGSAPLAVTFTAIGYDVPQSGSDYVVDFGDGNRSAASTGSQCLQINGELCGGGSPKYSASHTYQSSGTYTATLYLETNLCGGSTLSGCVSDLQVGSTTVTVESGASGNSCVSDNTTYPNGATIECSGVLPIPAGITRIFQ